MDNGAKARGLCPNCNHHSGFELEDRRQVWPLLWSPASKNPPIMRRRWVEEDVYTCLHCKHTSVFLVGKSRVLTKRQGEPPTVFETSRRRVHPAPQPREMAETVPEEVRGLFLEGSRCEQADAYRAAAAMYRGAVERICDDRGASGPKLFERINDLANCGVSADIVADLHEARLLGNWSVHDGLEFSAEEVADVAELITEAVHVLYVQPEERRRMRESRKARREAHKAAGTT
ncbi:DUF4145 domain-containing protein [Streptacidiphilus sp. ASG 303]|uniref:DUF4145 domain-containing protein n=1 Tax=Streptacidiphilus sp. ASG 303 TaxID=2896847 RepID=UPI001E40DF1A|nr:DUF4145 domain-containing protein [Streptacidiphilus sp. ASG 303]MCD0486095.1 DUF4145 domain-containing protein [Streptacidiphilus sp. ASG 303]